jgi:hypothetical protein
MSLRAEVSKKSVTPRQPTLGVNATCENEACIALFAMPPSLLQHVIVPQVADDGFRAAAASFLNVSLMATMQLTCSSIAS